MKFEWENESVIWFLFAFNAIQNVLMFNKIIHQITPAKLNGVQCEFILRSQTNFESLFQLLRSVWSAKKKEKRFNIIDNSQNYI